MNEVIEMLNRRGQGALTFAGEILWQSSLLIALVFLVDLLGRRRLRPAIRYALWLLVIVKMVLPPSLAVPTGFSWWLRAVEREPNRFPTTVFINDAPVRVPDVPLAALAEGGSRARPQVSFAAASVVCWLGISLVLLGVLINRSRRVFCEAKASADSPDWLRELLQQTAHNAGLRRRVRLKLVDKTCSPAVCGLLRPIVLLPAKMAEELPPTQLQGVLCHEVMHLRRGDVWVNCVQALVQIVFWWHPLLWFANSRIRRLREEAVDDAVMMSLKDEAENYAPTLLHIARLMLQRPAATLGLVGIMESQSALRQRIERLANFKAPRKAGLTLLSMIMLASLAAVALPMGQPPGESEPAASAQTQTNIVTLAPFNPGLNQLQNGTETSPLAGQPLSGEALRHAQQLLIESKAEYSRQEKLLEVLKSLPAGELPQTLATVLPDTKDQLLTTFLENLSLSEQRLASLQREYGPTHTEVRKTEAMIADMQTRIQERTEGIIKGLEIRLQSMAAGIDSLQKELDRVSQSAATAATGSTRAAPASPQIHIGSKFIEVPEEVVSTLLQSIAITNVPAAGETNWSMVLTPAQAAAALQALKANPLASIAAETSVVTLWDRQAEIQCVEMQTVVTNIDPQALQPPGVPKGSPAYLTTTIPVGPTLDVFPQLAEDQTSIKLTLTPSLTEFLGYDQPTNSVSIYVDGKKGQGVMPLPRFRVRSVTSTLTIADGYTVIIGAGIAEHQLLFKDKVPVLGDIPLAGRLFRSESKGVQKKQLLVFVTPTLIDAAGNRLHSDK